MAASDSLKPLCFVLMPFGKRKSGERTIDFDKVYTEIYIPAIEDAGLEAIRADEEQTGGVIHVAMFERLILCDFAIADLTGGNANVFYELGVRHAIRRHSTLLTFAQEGGDLPFDVRPLRGIPYELTAEGRPADAAKAKRDIIARLNAAKLQAADSPVFQLVRGYPDVSKEATDTFRARERRVEEAKRAIERTPSNDSSAIAALEQSLASDPALADPGILISLLLAYRGAEAWREMVSLISRMSPELADSSLVQEQYGLALNRLERDEEAYSVTFRLIKERGATAERYGILGRILKDRWEVAHAANQTVLARGLLDQAINAYRLGFEADWRDYYPGINAVTLMARRGDNDDAFHRLVAVVRYSTERKLASGEPSYWDHATALELAVLAGDRVGAAASLSAALACSHDGMKRGSTARNLRILRDAPGNHASVDWIEEMIVVLDPPRVGR
jgi:tetratricopeptide (TPR) repeat protein